MSPNAENPPSDENLFGRMPDFPIEAVQMVYVGKEGCRCGCLGRYYVLSQNMERADKARGYACPDDVNNGMVKRVVERLRAEGIDLPESPHDGAVLTTADGRAYFFNHTFDNGRVWSVYLFEEQAVPFPVEFDNPQRHVQAGSDGLPLMEIGATQYYGEGFRLITRKHGTDRSDEEEEIVYLSPTNALRIGEFAKRAGYVIENGRAVRKSAIPSPA